MNMVRGPWAKQVPPHEEMTDWSPAEEWHGHKAPQIDWLVENAFMKGTVGILAGDGGLGKSLLLQQLTTACAIGVPWLGMRTQPLRSLAVYCEDDMDELHRRQERINSYYGCSMKHLEPLRIDSRPGRDCVLMEFGRWGGDGRVTPLFNQLWELAHLHQAQIVILDTVADVFNGNEIDRNQPRTFIRELRKLALAIQGVVILTQHPSNEGMASGSGRSGSTGWHNSVRSRLYLTKPKAKGDESEESNERHLRTMKNNAGRFGGKVRIEWKNGVFVLMDDAAAVRPYWTDKPDWRDD